MCGIIGIASNKSVSSAIINSLRKLEYRGYDSAGIATLSDGILNEAKSEGRVDILSSTIGKALGGAGGGFIASKKEIIEKLRNKSRPYLFSNNILPMVAAVGIEIIKMLQDSKSLIKKLAENYPITIKATFLGAHAFPLTYKENHAGYIDLLIND